MTTATSTDAAIATVRSLFDAFAHHHLAALDEIFAVDATWNHRNHDRLGGIHRGSDGITAYLAESAQLRAAPYAPSRERSWQMQAASCRCSCR